MELRKGYGWIASMKGRRIRGYDGVPYATFEVVVNDLGVPPWESQS